MSSTQTLVKDITEIILSHWSLLSKTYKWSHSITQTTLLPSPDFCFILIIALSLFWFWVIENQLYLLSFLHLYKFFFFLFRLACNTDSILKYTHSVDCRDFQHKTISGFFIQLSKRPPYFCLLKVMFKYNCKYSTASYNMSFSSL